MCSSYGYDLLSALGSRARVTPNVELAREPGRRPQLRLRVAIFARELPYSTCGCRAARTPTSREVGREFRP